MDDRQGQDLVLIERALAGDAEAFGDLVSRYQNMVASVAWRFGTPRDEIEDLVAEVFLKVYRSLDRYRPEHPFSTWLYRVAQNEAVDRARRRRREAGRADELPETIAAPGQGAGRAMLADERARLLRQALAELPAHYREVLALVHFEEMRVEDAARALGIPEGTAKTRLMRGRRALGRLLARRWPDVFGDRA
ncbi:MAG: RNA polymerase sigma factor RpoE [Acidobacteriota bacterium]|nr:MAG: sigma-70 family RNA polymerase sigma factor [Acidobacteriota bacterium]